jgi:uncharacterized membrane protein
MNELIAVVYSDEHRAAEVLATLRRLPVARLIPWSDVTYVTKGRDETITLHRITNLSTTGAAPEAVSGLFWGPLMAFLLLVPIADAVVGTGPSSHVEGTGQAEWGISDRFVEELGAAMVRNSSAIFMVMQKAPADKVVTGVRQFGGTLLRTPLSPQAEAKLQADLGR